MTDDAQSLAEQCGTSVHATEALLCKIREQKIKHAVGRIFGNTSRFERTAALVKRLRQHPPEDMIQLQHTTAVEQYTGVISAGPGRGIPSPS